MRNATVLLILGSLTLPASTWAKGRPQPITCPLDVAVYLAETCPCAGKTLPDLSVQPWRNHGQYVSCVAHTRNALRRADCLTTEARHTIVRCAARSTCGKDTAVLCCTYATGTCTGDPAPGDMTKAGSCSNDAALACDTDADCTQSRARIAHDEATCTAGGGTSVGAGNVCDPCPTTTTTTTTTTTLP